MAKKKKAEESPGLPGLNFQPPPGPKETGRVFYFRMLPVEGAAADIEALLRAWTAANPAGFLDFEHRKAEYKFCEPHWDDSGGLGVFSATISRAATEADPALQEKGLHLEELVLLPNKSLGMPMCFAYDPVAGVAGVFSSHRGPTHAVIPALFNELGFPHKVEAARICWDDVMEQLDGMGVAVRFDLGVKDTSDDRLKDAGESVERAIESARAARAGAFYLTMSRGKSGEEMDFLSLKNAVRNLRKIGMANVSALRLKAAESHDSEFQLLDFVSARIQSEIEIHRVNRRMDRLECQRSIVEKLKGVLPDIRKQKRS